MLVSNAGGGGGSKSTSLNISWQKKRMILIFNFHYSLYYTGISQIGPPHFFYSEIWSKRSSLKTKVPFRAKEFSLLPQRLRRAINFEILHGNISGKKHRNMGILSRWSKIQSGFRSDQDWCFKSTFRRDHIKSGEHIKWSRYQERSSDRRFLKFKFWIDTDLGFNIQLWLLQLNQFEFAEKV